MKEKAPTKQEVAALRAKDSKRSLAALAGGFLSPLAAKTAARDLGYRVHAKVGGALDNSKYRISELSDMRQKNGVGRPLSKQNSNSRRIQNAQMNMMHEKIMSARAAG